MEQKSSSDSFIESCPQTTLTVRPQEVVTLHRWIILMVSSRCICLQKTFVFYLFSNTNLEQWVIFKPRLHDTTCCQTRCPPGCIVYTYIQPVVKPVWQPVWQTAVSCIQPVVKPVVQPCLTTGWMFVYTINSVVKPVWQSVVSCKWGINGYCNQLVQVPHIYWMTTKTYDRNVLQIWFSTETALTLALRL